MAPIRPYLVESLPEAQSTDAMINGYMTPLEERLLATLERSPYSFLQPDPDLQSAALRLGKGFLDPIATSVTALQAERVQENRRKRKRGQSYSDDEQTQLRLKQLYLEGFGIQQVWEQAKRVLEANAAELEGELTQVAPLPAIDDRTNGYSKESSHDDIKSVHFNEDGFEVGNSDIEGLGDGDSGEEEEDDEAAEGVEADGIEGGTEPATGDEYDLDEEAEDDADEEDLMGESDIGTSSSKTFVVDKHGLNDGFFSIEEFNGQSEFLEQQDARGDPDDGAASDEEDIDWSTNPLSAGNWGDDTFIDTNSKRTRRDNSERAKDEDEGLDSDDEDDGPTFGNGDLDADEPDSETDEVLMDGGVDSMNGPENTNNIRYADFFEPPPRKATKDKFDRALPKTQPLSALVRDQPDEDLQQTMDAVRRDIFEDDSVGSATGSDASFDVADPLFRRSNHQKRHAKLAAEIRRLEAANVAKRDWQLSGEARASDRPLNSLLEEDLDFERVGKPVPVITNEVSEDIESLIKRRILAREFDEVVRRRPDNLVTDAGRDIRRGRFELDDTKPKQSLAEIYEAEHLQNADPEGFVSKSDEKLKAQHEEIERLWKDVSAKLDALTSWHYKPAPPNASINIVTNVPTVNMEDARPTAGGEAAGTSMLAPQEVYRAGEATDKKAEIMPKGGAAVRRDEMSKEDKRRRRRREKERIRKAGGVVERTDQKAKITSTIVKSKKAKEQDAVLGQLKKGGVRVIGRRGDLQDVEGKEVKDKSTIKGAGAYKL